MVDIHCHSCGGFITDPRRITHRLPSHTAPTALPTSSCCTCTPPIVYGPPSGYLSSPGMPRADHRSAWQTRQAGCCEFCCEFGATSRRIRSAEIRHRCPEPRV